MAVECPKCHSENPDTVKFCGECGTQLSLHEGPAVSKTLTLETQADELTRGMLFAGRYEVIEELGTGGMGRVYRVHDTKLNEEVALKLIKPEIASARGPVERFRNEIKIARKIAHPNVCRVHDLHEEGKTLFLTMEYVRGEDLKSLIHRTKALTVGSAVSYARQIAEGLREAHKLGIVHRDLKPGNIMIDTDGQAKIMDFGIARVKQEKGITGEGAVIGTPEYMSPEQVEGKEADPRSDIYALGVILFEMVTGQTPFEGETPLSIAHKHRYEPPPDPSVLNPQIPPGLSQFILRCMEKPLEKRYQTTGELLSDLEAVKAILPATERSVGRTASGTRPKTSREVTVTFGLKKAVMIGAGVVFIASAALFVWKPWDGKKSPLPTAEKASLAVLDFDNTSRDGTLDEWRTGIPLLLAQDLGQSKYLSVLSYDQIVEILGKLDLQDRGGFSSAELGRIAAKGRVAHTVSGSMMKAGERIIVVLSVKNHATGQVQTAKFECAGEAGIPSLVDQMTPRIKEMMGLRRSQVSGDLDALTVEIFTHSVEALKLYNEGRRLHMAGKVEESIPLMLKAIEKDPEFALAYRSLSAALWELGRTGESNAYSQKAFEFSAKVSPKERFWIQASYYSRSEATYDRALEVCKEWLKLYPEDTHAMQWAGRQYLYKEDFGQAVKILQAAVEKGIVNPYTFVFLAQACYSLGEYEKGCRAAELGLSILPGNSRILGTLFQGYICQGKIEEAQALLGKYQAQVPPGSFDSMKAVLSIVEGKNEEAAEILATSKSQNLAYLKLAEGQMRQALGLVRDAPDPRARAHLEYQAGNFKEALAESEEALKEGFEQGSFSGRAWALQMKGLAELAMGSREAAMKTAAELKACTGQAPMPNLIRHFDFLMGMIEREADRYPVAVDYLTRAIGLLPAESFFQGSWYQALFIDALAGTYFSSGDLSRAEEAYKKVQSLALVKLNYGDIYAKSFYWLGRIAEKRGDRVKAAEKYGTFLDLWKDADPGLPEVEDARNRLAGL